MAGAERPRGDGVLERALGANDRPHAARDEGCAEDRENSREHDEHLPRRQHERQHGAQRQRHVNGRQHQHEIGHAHQRIVHRAADIAGRAADHAAEKCRAHGCRERERERHARAEQEAAEDVAPEAVGANQHQRRPPVV